MFIVRFVTMSLFFSFYLSLWMGHSFACCCVSFITCIIRWLYSASQVESRLYHFRWHTSISKLYRQACSFFTVMLVKPKMLQPSFLLQSAGNHSYYRRCFAFCKMTSHVDSHLEETLRIRLAGRSSFIDSSCNLQPVGYLCSSRRA